MEGKMLPAGMDEVAGSLEEAAGYERLALARRGGTLGLVSAFLMAALLLFKVLGGDLVPLNPMGILVFVVTFGISLGMRPLLRKRPGWEPLFPQPRGKRFWKRYALSNAFLLALTIAGGLIVFQPGFSPALRAAFMPAMFGLVFVVMQWLVPRSMPGRYGFLALFLAAALLAIGLVPETATVEVTIATLALGLLAESAYRLFAPRRWLVR